MRIRPRHVLLLLLLVLGLLWGLLRPGDAGTGAKGAGPSDAEADGSDPESMSATGAAQPAGAGGTPRLQGSSTGVADALRDIELQIVGRGGTPVPAVRVGLLDVSRGHARLSSTETTDAGGRARFRRVRPGSPSANVLLPIKEKIPQRLVVPVLRSPQVITVPWLRRCTYRVVDAETGVPVRTAEVSLFDPFARAWTDPAPADASPHVAWDLANHVARSAFPVRLSAAGYVHWDQKVWEQVLSAYAERVEVMVPLRPEVDVRLTILDHNGVVSADAQVSAFMIGGRVITKPKCERDGFGTLHLRGVPFLRRGALKVFAELSGVIASASVRSFLGTDPAVPVLLEIRLPKPQPRGSLEGANSNSAIGIGGGRGYRDVGRSNKEKGAVEVHVSRHDGSPAVGARVSVARRTGRTNAHGVARIEGIPVGERRVGVEQRGLLSLPAQTITIRAGSTTKVIFREARGATLRIEVVDDLGAPLPYATVNFRSGGWPKQHIDERGGLQRVDGYVDHLGGRSFGRLNPAEDTVHVEWGGRSGSAKLELTSGKTAKIRIVLPAPPGAPKR